MRTIKYLLVFAAVIAIVALFTYTEAGAAIDGDCVVGSPEDMSSNCGNFGGNVIEFVEAANDTCTTSVYGGSGPCTKYTYKYTGSSSNQIVVSIPVSVMTKFQQGVPNSTDSAAAGCNQLITDGTGDTSSTFGDNDVTHNVCRLPPSIDSGEFFDIYADPSSPLPLSWQARYSKRNIFADSVLGPGTPGLPLTTTAIEVTTTDGATCLIEIVGGVPVINLSTCTGGRILPIANTKLCTLNEDGDPVPFDDEDFADNWTCESIEFVTPENAQIKTTGSDPCVYAGGFAVCW